MEGAILYKEESYAIIGICMEVHRILGPGLLEIVYKDALELEFRHRNIPYHREKPFEVEFKGVILPHRFYADFVVYDNIVLEIKACDGIVEEFIKRTLNYISIAKSRLGLIVNFGNSSLQHKRVIR